MTPLIYLQIKKEKIQPFNHQKRHTQTSLMFLKHLKIPQDYDALVQNVIASPESPAKVFIKFNSSQQEKITTKRKGQ